MEHNKLAQYDSLPAYKAVLKMAIPAVVSMLMVLVYNLADTFFIGLTHEDLQVAAVSLASPIFMIFIAIGSIFEVGGTSVISRAFGEGRHEFAQKVAAFCVWASLALGIVLSALIYLFIDPLLSMIGASEDTWDFAKNYLQIVAMCGPFILLSFSFSNIIRAEGHAPKAMLGNMLGNAVNVVLDPLFILGLGWGITGAAVATVLGNMVGAGFYMVHFLQKKSSLSIHIRGFSMRGNVAKSVLSIGTPAMLGQLTVSVAQALMYGRLAKYSDMAVAGAGVAMLITFITGVFAISVGGGVQPLLGFCVGSLNRKRFVEILRFAVILSTVLCVLATVLSLIFTPQIVGLFLTEAKPMELGVTFARIMQSAAILFGVFQCLTNALQSMGEAIGSLLISISRRGLYIPAMFLLEFALGMNGLLWAQPTADVVSLVLAALLFAAAYRRFKRLCEKPAAPLSA